MTRLADVVDLVAPHVLVAFLAAAAAMGCGGAALSPGDSGAADGPRDGVLGVDIPGVTGLVAGNGNPIPDPLLQDTCTTLGIAETACAPSDACPALTCSCGGVQKKIVPATSEFTSSCLTTGACLTGISCPAACATSDLAQTELYGCLSAGVCATDADCTNPGKPHCLVGLDGNGGHCISGQSTSDCYRDSDCMSSTCVAVGGNARWCVDKAADSLCNRNDQCPAPASGTGKSACIMRAADVFGRCSNGTSGAFCLKPDDCLPGYACTQLDAGDFGVCSSRGVGAPCAVDADCAQGPCLKPPGPGSWGNCDKGPPGAPCTVAADCLMNICTGSICQADPH